MERLTDLAKDLEGREPSIDEVIELLACIATAPYGVNPHTVRDALRDLSVPVSQLPVVLPTGSALALAECRADAVRVLTGILADVVLDEKGASSEIHAGGRAFRATTF